MPCWVAPVIAAELWGVSLNRVLGAIEDGFVPSRQEYGFTVVDVETSTVTHPSPHRRFGPPPPTYVLVSDLPPAPPPLPPAEPAQPADKIESAELPPLDDEEDDRPISHWRQARSRVARTRRPPPQAA
jgi:hypothetical protein